MKCPECSHANDVDFRFCQRCGYKQRIRSTSHVQSGLQVDLETLDNRLRELLDYDHATKYSKQKDSIQCELESFLAALPSSITLAMVTPRNVCQFLVLKDTYGKMQIHRNSCQFLCQRGQHPCGCPCRLSYKTADSYIGKLRSIFHAQCRYAEWDNDLPTTCKSS